jgi:hypothetical protein
MKILILDSYYRMRDMAQMDIYKAMELSGHEIIYGNQLEWWRSMQWAGDYDALYLGLVHENMGIDWPALYFLNHGRPIYFDQADNEEFVSKHKARPYLKEKHTVISRYLPNARIESFVAKIGYKLHLMPWYVDADRIRSMAGTQSKDIDVSFICSKEGIQRRGEINEVVNQCVREFGLSHCLDDLFASAYYRMLARSKVLIIECDRKCLTQKYIEAAVLGCHIIGDRPIYPANNLQMTECNLMDKQSIAHAINSIINTQPPDNSAFIAEYCNHNNLKLPF